MLAQAWNQGRACGRIPCGRTIRRVPRGRPPKKDAAAAKLARKRAAKLEGQLSSAEGLLIQRPTLVKVLHSGRGARAGRSHQASRSATTHSAHRQSSRHSWQGQPGLGIAVPGRTEDGGARVDHGGTFHFSSSRTRRRFINLRARRPSISPPPSDGTTVSLP
jgi:hypothetical protein